MRYLKWFLIFWLGYASSAFAEPIQVSVDRDSVTINQSFKITFIVSEAIDSNPDISLLEREFEIIDRDRSSNVSWINGVSSSSTQWTFDVIAKHAGKLTIPPLHFGQQISPALAVTVTENAQQAATAENNAELFLEVSAAPEKVFVQSQVLFTLRFYRRVNIENASLKDPELTDAVVTKLDEDKSYKKELHGVPYLITERHYAVFPQKSGQLTLPSLVLTAEVLTEDTARMGGFFSTRTTRTERISSKPVTLTVLPTPADFKGRWLVAEQLRFAQQWSGDVLKMKVGEPLTRTMTLQATGTTVSQLPSLQQSSKQEALKSYPDQPHLEEQKTATGIVAVREEKTAFIPTKAGTYTLPALEIPWFNVKTQQQEIAKIDPVTLIVAAADNTTPAVIDKPVEKPLKNNALSNTPVMITPPSAPIATTHSRLWQILAGVFALAWMITLFFLLKKKALSDTESAALQSQRHLSAKQNYLALKKVCMTNNATAVKQALLNYAQQQYSLNSWSALLEQSNPDLQQQLIVLNQHLYGQSKTAWQSEPLWLAFNQQFKTTVVKTTQPEPLEPLHRL